MNEKLLQYIWQFQYFNISNLYTQNGEPVTIIYAGSHNSNQGPDFSNAKIKIGDTTWAGNVELHVQSSDWKAHKHAGDANYKNIILHVVWDDNEDLQLPFPVLELKHKVSKILLEKYDGLMQAPMSIPCANNICQVSEIVWANWKERLLVERLLEKAKLVLGCLEQNNNHWEETFWWMLAKNFGIKVNSEAFEKIARSIPVNLLAKHKNQVQQVEALLMGQANLLHGIFEDDYCVLLQKEYDFLRKKYQLQPVQIPLHYLRMRPSNFPTVRLAQLAMLVHQSSHLFSTILAAANVKEVLKLLNVTANDYWHYHYLPGEAAAFKKKNLGRQMAGNIVINTVVPVMFAYGHYLSENSYKEKALQWLEALPAEKNSITQSFSGIGLSLQHAFDSQAFIQLKNNYCNHKRCLDCAIGNSILKK